eukprot:COSAG06_NODE_1644_length_8819_cov_13.898624_2_plen_62_part_00
MASRLQYAQLKVPQSKNLKQAPPTALSNRDGVLERSGCCSCVPKHRMGTPLERACYDDAAR